MHCLCAALGITVAALTIGCGDDAGAGNGGRLTISAAASLSEAFAAYGEARPGEQRFSFAGSDDLAAQIRQGARPDVFAAASLAYPDRLAAESLVERPVVFARNELVIAVPHGSAIDSLDDLTEPGLDLAIGAEAVPVGGYARDLLRRLPARERSAILANVRSDEPDVKGIVGKVAQGAADAGLVYSSDVAAAADDLDAVALPARLEPDIAYAVAVVSGTANREASRAFIRGLLDGAGRQALEAASFRPADR